MKMYAHGWKRDGNVYAVQINDVASGDKKEYLCLCPSAPS